MSQFKLASCFTGNAQSSQGSVSNGDQACPCWGPVERDCGGYIIAVLHHPLIGSGRAFHPPGGSGSGLVINSLKPVALWR